MDRASATMTAALGCSGFVSYDFMLDRETGRAALIEMNPRSVSSTHLGAVFGRDICGAFAPNCQAHRCGGAASADDSRCSPIPEGIGARPEQPLLQSPHIIHDVPKDDPALVEAYLRLLTAVHPAKANELRMSGDTASAGGRGLTSCQTPFQHKRR